MMDPPCENDSAEEVRRPLTGDDSLTPKQGHNLEDSSPWRLSFTEWQHPAAVLTLISIPFCVGAYVGYKIPISKFEELVGSDPSPSNPHGPPATKASTVVGSGGADVDTRKLARRVALKALRVATLGTVGTFGMVGAIWFAANGCHSFDEAIRDTKSKTSAWRESLEHFFGGDTAISRTHPDVLATRNMTEDEELQYLYRKYFKGAGSDIQVDSKKTNTGNTHHDGVNRPRS